MSKPPNKKSELIKHKFQIGIEPITHLKIIFKLHVKTFDSRNASIYSLSFSPDSMYLSASSNLETIHIFRLDVPKEK